MSRTSFFDGADGADGANGAMIRSGMNGVGSTGDNSFLGYSGTVSNPMLVSALIQSRAGIVYPDTDKGDIIQYKDRGHAERLRMRDANTRGYLAQVELMSKLMIDANDDQHGSDECKISYLTKAGESYTPKTLATIKRPNVKYFRDQLNMVLDRAALRSDRTPEILSQVRPQYAYWASICNLNPETTPRTIELTYSALHFSMLVTQRVKHALDCPRPNEYSNIVQPIILTPAYMTLPGGHRCEADMFAKVMTKLTDSAARARPRLKEQLNRLAKRVADNREYAGVHFHVDAHAGYVLADALAAYFVARCGVAPVDLRSRTFDVDKLMVKNGDSSPVKLAAGDIVDPTQLDETTFLGTEEFEVERSALLAALWDEAKAEIKRQG